MINQNQRLFWSCALAHSSSCSPQISGPAVLPSSVVSRPRGGLNRRTWCDCPQAPAAWPGAAAPLLWHPQVLTCSQFLQNVSFLFPQVAGSCLHPVVLYSVPAGLTGLTCRWMQWPRFQHPNRHWRQWADGSGSGLSRGLPLFSFDTDSPGQLQGPASVLALQNLLSWPLWGSSESRGHLSGTLTLFSPA